MTVQQPNRTRRTPLGDTSIRGGLNDRPKNFKVKRGAASIVRVLTHPVAYYGARINYAGNPQKGFFALSLASVEDNELALQGDPAAIARCKQVCPVWARGYDIGQRFVSMMWEAAQVDNRGRKQPCEKLWPWAFSAKIYQQLTSIANTLPVHPSTGQPIPFNRIELQCDVGPGAKDEDFQNLNIVPLTQKSQMTSTFGDVWAKASKFFHDTNDPNVIPADPYGDTVTSSILEDFLAADSFKAMEDSLDRAEGRGKFATEPDPNADLGGDLDAGQAAPQQQRPIQAAPRAGTRAAAAPSASAPAATTTRPAPATQPAARSNAAPQQRQAAPAQQPVNDPGADLDNLLPAGGELDLD